MEGGGRAEAHALRAPLVSKLWRLQLAAKPALRACLPCAGACGLYRRTPGQRRLWPATAPAPRPGG